MQDPQPRALLYYHVADKAYMDPNANSYRPVFLVNQQKVNDSGARVPMSNDVFGKYNYTQGTSTYPGYVEGFHITTSKIPVFNKDFVVFGPDYDVVELSVFSNILYDTYHAQHSTAFKPNITMYENSLSTGMAISRTTNSSTFSLFLPCDTVLGGSINGYPTMTQSGIFTTDFSGITSSGDGLVSTYPAQSVYYDPNTYYCAASDILWNPYNSATDTVDPTIGGTYWVAVRWHKYVPGSNQIKLSVLSSLCNNGQTIKTVTISVGSQTRGSLFGTGAPITAPRAAALGNRLRAHAIYSFSDADVINWSSNIKQQGDQWCMTNPERPGLTPFSQNQIGPYVNNPSPHQDMSDSKTRKITDPKTGCYIIGRIATGERVSLRITVNAYDITPTGNTTNGVARVDLVSPNGITVPQFIRVWGSGKTTSDGFITTNFKWGGVVEIVVTPGAISDYRGCVFNVYDSTGAIEFSCTVSETI